MKKYLFLIDLDGTLLANSGTGKISDKDVAAVTKLQEAGHIVCLATGRPWRSTEKAYNKLKLNTIVANYNGAQIHNPRDYTFIQHISYLDLNNAMYILGDKEIRRSMANLAIEGPGWVMIDHREQNLEKIFGFESASNYKVGINWHKLPLRPTGIIFDTKENVNPTKLRKYLTRTYGDLAEFSYWSKGEGLAPVFDMTNIGITKAKALSLMARYYDVPIEQTVAIGDGFNDIPMFKVAQISVAMANAEDDIKSKAQHVTTSSNLNSGVSEFISDFLANKNNKYHKN